MTFLTCTQITAISCLLPPAPPSHTSSHTPSHAPSHTPSTPPRSPIEQLVRAAQEMAILPQPTPPPIEPGLITPYTPSRLSQPPRQPPHQPPTAPRPTSAAARPAAVIVPPSPLVGTTWPFTPPSPISPPVSSHLLGARPFSAATPAAAHSAGLTKPAIENDLIPALLTAPLTSPLKPRPHRPGTASPSVRRAPESARSSTTYMSGPTFMNIKLTPRVAATDPSPSSARG